MKNLMESLDAIEPKQVNEWGAHDDVRKMTNKIIEAIEEGILDWETVGSAALSYMSESDVADMSRINDWNYFDDEEEFEEGIGDTSRGFSTSAIAQAESDQWDNLDYSSIEIDGVDSRDYPDFSDAHVAYAEWKDGTPLTDDELIAFDPDGSYAQENAFETLL
jgi:hypothetical protein